jgi:hypothetical protein
VNSVFRKIISFASSTKFHFAVIGGLALSTGIISWMVMPNGGIDMRDDILPSLWNWRSPWEEGTPLFPWATLILMPLRFFSPRCATAIINGLSVILLALVIRRFDGNILSTIPIVLSPIGYRLFTTGQTDAVVLAGIFLPAGLDLLLFWKPQVLAHIFWVRGMERPRTYLVAGSILLAFSFFVWGEWWVEIWHFGRSKLIDGWWNFSLWPYSVPIGILMVYLSLRKKDIGYGIIASPLLFPYVNGPSYVGLLAVVAAKWPGLFRALCILLLLYLLLVIFVPSLNLPGIY